MFGLPNLSTLPLFQYYDQVKNALQEITYPNGFRPRPMEDYVLDMADWHPTNRTRPSSTCPFGIIPPHGTKTGTAVLGWEMDDDPCRICGREGTRCFGDSCVRSFQTSIERANEGKLRTEKATNAAMGYGVFALAEISEDTLVGEYMGKLVPLDEPRKF